MRSSFIVTYDISDDRRWAKVYKIMRRYGDHLQYSVFECRFTPTALAQCKHQLGEVIDHRQDQVLFVDLGPAEGRGERVITAVGRPYAPIQAPCIVVDGEGGR